MVLSDLRMLGMSGWEVARSIKKLDPEVIFAIITGWGVQIDGDELKKNVVDLLVNKPFRVDQILRLTQEVMKIKDKVKGRKN